HRNEQAEHRNRREPEVLDDFDVLPGRELADQVRRGHQQHGKRDEVVEHPVANRLFEHIHRDVADGSHALSEKREGCAPLTCRTKKSSSVSRIGVSDTSAAPCPTSSASVRSGGGVNGSSSAYRPSTRRVARVT